MYTNELLEEKYKAQKALYEKAKKCSTDYFVLVEKEVRDLFEKRGWELNFSQRKGEWQVPDAIQD